MPSVNTLNFLATLRAERQRKGLTLQQVGELLGRSTYNTVWQWERGANEPKLSNFVAWAAVLGYRVVLVPTEGEAASA